jgi:transposase
VQEVTKHRKVNRELLRRVAQTHAAATGARVPVVAEEFGVSMRTAHRYIAAARAAGLLTTEDEVGQE